MQCGCIPSCTNAVLLRHRFNMSDFSSIPPQGKRRKHMTIAEVLQKATEGGYHIYGSDGMDTDYGGANSEYSMWTRKDNASSFIIPVAETFLDPDFWQALGRALEWEYGVMTVHAMENGRATIITRARHHWLYHWHRFIDHLAERHPPASFFASLPCSETGGTLRGYPETNV